MWCRAVSVRAHFAPLTPALAPPRAQTVVPYAEKATMAKARRIQNRLTGSSFVVAGRRPGAPLFDTSLATTRYGPAPSRARLVRRPLLWWMQLGDEVQHRSLSTALPRRPPAARLQLWIREEKSSDIRFLRFWRKCVAGQPSTGPAVVRRHEARDLGSRELQRPDLVQYQTEPP